MSTIGAILDIVLFRLDRSFETTFSAKLLASFLRVRVGLNDHEAGK